MTKEDKLKLVKDQYFNGIVDMASNITLEGNTISKGIYFNQWNGGIRNNIFQNLTTVNYYKRDGENITLDISHNYWDIEEDLTSVLRFDELGENDTVIFEPYYDSNGRLTDNDGLPNPWELKYGLDIYSDNSEEDVDNDGLTNIEEYLISLNGTDFDLNPTSEDTDEDGMDDFWEVRNGLLPNYYDSHLDYDKDRKSNFREYLDGTDPRDPDDYKRRSTISEDSFYSIVIIFFLAILTVIIMNVIIVVIFLRRRRQRK